MQNTPMKHLLVFLALLPALVHAQNATPSSTPAPEKKLNVPKLMQREDGLLLRFSLDNYTNLPKDIETNLLGSRGFSFLLMGEQMNATNHFGTAFGLGMSSLRVDHNAMAATDTDGVGTVLVPIPDSLDYKQNRYVMNSIDAAFEFRFRGNPNKNHKHFKFSLGFRAGYVIQSHLKYKDEDVKYKLYSIEDIQRWRYGVTGRIGLGHLALDAYYSLAPLYKEGKGPADMMPYSIGIAWTF